MGQNELQLSQIPTVNTAMLIRRPPAQVFKALVDPDVTTGFWFTNSTGKLMPGAHVRWDSEMYGASADVHVKELEEDHRILIEWGEGDEFATVEFLLVPFDDDATFVEVTESGFAGTGDELLARVAGSTGGFTIMLCALKALLEHDVVLTAVADRFPKGLDH